MALGPGGRRSQGCPGCSCCRRIGCWRSLQLPSVCQWPSCLFTQSHSLSLTHSFNCRSSGRVRGPFKVPPFKTTTLPPFGQKLWLLHLSRAEDLLEEQPGQQFFLMLPKLSYKSSLQGQGMCWLLILPLSCSLYIFTHFCIYGSRWPQVDGGCAFCRPDWATSPAEWLPFRTCYTGTVISQVAAIHSEIALAAEDVAGPHSRHPPSSHPYHTPRGRVIIRYDHSETTWVCVTAFVSLTAEEKCRGETRGEGRMIKRVSALLVSLEEEVWWHPGGF